MSSNGRIFTSFPRGNETFTLAEANTATTEVPFPEYVDLPFEGVSGAEHGRCSQDSNTPEAFVNTTNPGFSIATDKFLLVQAVVVDGLDRIWALDVGRPRVNGTTLMAASPGGPKLLGFHQNGTRFATFTFPASVVPADSSLNDLRIDLRGDGFAYLPDSSPQRPGLVVVNLRTGVSWRHLDNHPSVTVQVDLISFHNGGRPRSVGVIEGRV